NRYHRNHRPEPRYPRGIVGGCTGGGSIVITGITARTLAMPKRDRSGSLSPLVTDFLAELAHANRSRHTCRAYATDLAQFAAFYAGPRNSRSLFRPPMRKPVGHLAARRLSPRLTPPQGVEPDPAGVEVDHGADQEVAGHAI